MNGSNNNQLKMPPREDVANKAMVIIKSPPPSVNLSQLFDVD